MVFIPKPVLHLKMEGNADDFSGYDNHGIVTDATLTDDRWGNPNNAYSFNGTTAFIDCGNHSSLNITDEITMEAWIYPITWGEISFGRIIDKTYATGYIWFICDSSGPNIKDMVVVCSGTEYYSDNYTISLKKWQHVVFTFNKNLTSNQINFFVNGIAAGTKTRIDSIGINADNLYIGNRVALDRTFDGFINVVRIYPATLTPTQVTYLYDKTKRKYGR